MTFQNILFGSTLIGRDWEAYQGLAHLVAYGTYTLSPYQQPRKRRRNRKVEASGRNGQAGNQRKKRK